MLPLHTAIVPTFLQLLPAVGRMIAKAEAFAAAQALPPAALTTARLAPDMWDFASQIQALTVQSAGALEGALAGSFAPAYPPAPHDFAALAALVTSAIARIKAIDPASIDALAGREVAVRFTGRELRFTAEGFLTGFALPNFQFHASMAYAILRSAGVPLGKADYLGRIPLLPE